MSVDTLKLEGRWEEIVARSEELAGRRVLVTVLPEEPEHNESPLLCEANQQMLAAYRDLQNTLLSDEEHLVLDEFSRSRLQFLPDLLAFLRTRLWKGARHLTKHHQFALRQASAGGARYPRTLPFASVNANRK